MSKKLKMRNLVAIILSAVIGLSLPLQVSAQNIPKNADDEIVTYNGQEAEPYEVGNILSEISEKREEYSKQFRLDDGSYMAVSYDQPVHFKDNEGKWIEYDNSLIEEKSSSATSDQIASDEYTNKRSDVKVNYSQKSKDTNMIKIKADNYKVSWGYKNTNKVKAEIIKNNENLTGNEKYTVLKNMSSEVIYKDIFDNVDI